MDNAGEFPSETRERDYLRRMDAAYPIHPELFDRVHQDRSTLERFQRTRGVLWLMASVISELWDRDAASLMIMPGVVPMDSAKVVPEPTRYLTDQRKPIIDADVDGSRVASPALRSRPKEPGQVLGLPSRGPRHLPGVCAPYHQPARHRPNPHRVGVCTTRGAA